MVGACVHIKAFLAFFDQIKEKLAKEGGGGGEGALLCSCML